MQLVPDRFGALVGGGGALHQHLPVQDNRFGEQIVFLHFRCDGNIAGNDIDGLAVEQVETLVECHLELHLHFQSGDAGNSLAQLILEAEYRVAVDKIAGRIVFCHHPQDAFLADLGIIARRQRLLFLPIRPQRSHRRDHEHEEGTIDP